MTFPRVLTTLLLAGTVILLVPVIDSGSMPVQLVRQTDNGPFFLKVLGEARTILSSISLLEADRYFHAGKPHLDEACEMTSSCMPASMHPAGHDGVSMGIFKGSFLMLLSDKLTVQGHTHLEDDTLREMMPWFYYAVNLDPHNTRAYALGGYYLYRRLDAPGKALSFLRQGLMYNPDSWEINGEIGKIYYHVYSEDKSALRYLLRAEKDLMVSDHDRFDERGILSYIALIYEKEGNTRKALEIYTRLLDLFPKAEVFSNKIHKLSAMGPGAAN